MSSVRLLLFACALGAVLTAATPSASQSLIPRSFWTPSTIQDRLKDRMRDPESTRIRGFTICKGKNTSAVMAYGEFNARNAYGGYVGYRPFFFMDGEIEVYGDVPYDVSIGPTIGVICGGTHKLLIEASIARENRRIEAEKIR